MLGGAVDVAAQKPIDDLISELAQARAEAERLRADTTERLIFLEARAKELALEISRAYGEPIVTAVPPPLALVPPAHRVDGVKKKRRRPYRTHKDHPFPKLVGNIAEWCRAQKPPVPRSTARSWFTIDEPDDEIKLGRPIPNSFRLQLWKSHKVPLDCWPNGYVNAPYSPHRQNKAK